MSDLIWLSAAQMRRIEPYFPLSHGMPRVDDQRVISGIIIVIRNGLRWRDAPRDYGPHKTIYNRFVRRQGARHPGERGRRRRAGYQRARHAGDPGPPGADRGGRRAATPAGSPSPA